LRHTKNFELVLRITFFCLLQNDLDLGLNPFPQLSADLKASDTTFKISNGTYDDSHSWSAKMHICSEGSAEYKMCLFAIHAHLILKA
jgi:hypothetical protein